MEKVNTAVQLLQQLAAKYDSAYQLLTLQSDKMAAASNKMHSGSYAHDICKALAD